jgi:hypothetical protein
MVQVRAVALHPSPTFRLPPAQASSPLILPVCCAQAVIVAGIMEFSGAALLGAGVTGEQAVHLNKVPALMAPADC